jgi:hypothetical protein
MCKPLYSVCFKNIQFWQVEQTDFLIKSCHVIAKWFVKQLIVGGQKQKKSLSIGDNIAFCGICD